MTRKLPILTLVLAIAVIMVLAVSAYADTRSSLRDGAANTRENPIAPTPAPSPAPTPTPTPPPPAPSGSINNTTSGEAGSGGNDGGQVVTGDEHVEVHTVNEGPTNSNTVVSITTGGITPPPAPSPAPEPTSSCDPRSRECTESGGRGR